MGIEYGGGRSSEERRAAAEERARRRDAREQGLPVEEEPVEERSGWRRPDLSAMRRYGGGDEIYARRRVIAIVAVVGIVFILILMLGGC